MKKMYYYLLVGVCMLLTACSQDELSDLNVDNNEIKELSGSFSLSELPKTVDFNGTQITFTADMKSNGIQTKAATGLVQKGPFYTSGTPERQSTNEKVRILNDPILASNVYICDIYYIGGKIILPSNAIVGEIGLPEPCGFKNWSTQEKGIIWNLSTESSGKVLQWSFYTIVVRYDMLGRQINYTIPLDGAKVKVPYSYYVNE